MNTSVELKVEENKELIGGFVIRIDDKQYDASVASSLKEVKKQLLN
jgi:F-type H+-transporting ATPase subunit delta